MVDFRSNPLVAEDIERLIERKEIDWERFRNRKIAITGATGLIGRLLVRTLLEADRKYDLQLKLLLFCRNLRKAQELFGEVDPLKLHYVICDIMKPFPETEEADFMFHTASITASKTMVCQPVETILTAVLGTENAMRYAMKCHMESVVFLSSMEVYGVIEKGTDYVYETDLGYLDPLNIRSGYPEGKRLGECMCASFAGEYQVPVKIARLAASFGAGVDATDNRVYAQFARSIIRDKDIVLHTDGSKANSYCYLTDTVAGILQILLEGEQGQVYNVCNMDAFCTIRELAELFLKTRKSKGSRLVFDIPQDQEKLGYAPSSVMNLNSLRLMELGWKPRYSLTDLVTRVTESIRLQELE